jgi:putative DNA primase/helicase
VSCRSADITYADIAARIGSGWPAVHEQLGIPGHHLCNRHGPCPCCGGTDRFRYDDKDQRGTFFCNNCGPGDGFELLRRYHGWNGSKLRAELIEATGMKHADMPSQRHPATPRPVVVPEIAQPTPRVIQLRREPIPLRNCPDAVAYLKSRALWPRAEGTALRAHAGVDYYDDDRQRIGRYPALLASVHDINRDPVTVHVTYLAAGQKLAPHEPRKFMSGMVGRKGCAVRLYKIVGSTLGIAEGIETAISAAVIHGIPTWAALNTAMLRKFTPPPAVRRLVIFADADEAGLKAAAGLTTRVLDQVQVEVRPTPLGFKDWNDVLRAGPL